MISSSGFLSLQYLRICVPLEMSLADWLLCCVACAICYPGMDVITSIATIPTYKPAERIRLFNDFAQLIGDERAQTARAMWDRPLKTVYISDCGELKVTKQSLSPPSLPWLPVSWNPTANFVSLLLGSSLCTLWGVYYFCYLTYACSMSCIYSVLTYTCSLADEMIVLAYFLDSSFCISSAACRTLELWWVMANCTNFPCGRHCRWYHFWF